jgi:hypothetical protein
MDKIIRISLGLFVVILVVLVSAVSYQAFVENAYLTSLSSTYSYTCTITTDSSLYNVTLFLPVPVDTMGNSPIVSEFSNKMMTGVPSGWDTTLFDTGKSTLVKIMTPEIIAPDGTSAQHPYTIVITTETASRTPIDTRNPVEKSALFRPVQALGEKACPQAGSSRCFTYTTSLYADYSTSADTTVTITSSVTGKNTWKIFEPRSNEYHADISTSMKGDHKGWAVPAGGLSSGIGSYDIPAGA